MNEMSSLKMRIEELEIKNSILEKENEETDRQRRYYKLELS